MNGNGRKMSMWLTTSDKANLLHRQDDIPLERAVRTRGTPVIAIDELTEHQRMDGFGFSLTGASAYLIRRMTPERRHTLLRRLFSTRENGIGISMLRLSLGASDLSVDAFSYDDTPDGIDDMELKHFNIWAGDKDVIPIVQLIRTINPHIRIIASPWSAPAWMKSNYSLIGGRLRIECYAAYAQYFVRYLEAMRREEIPTHALTVQNEPWHDLNEPSMLMDPDEQAMFVGWHLGPALEKAGFSDVEVYCWDHNCDNILYPLRVYEDAAARKYLAGSAWHLYKGDVGILSELHEAYPDMRIGFTEQWTGCKSDFAGDLAWHAINVLIGAPRNWAQFVLEWNLASDPGQILRMPLGRGYESLGAVTISADDVTANVSYYIIGHASRFVPPGSTRLASMGPDDLPNVAYRTKGGGTVLIVFNRSKHEQTFFVTSGKAARVTLPGMSLATLVW